MNIRDFIAKFTNHPVLFLGTGISLRYLKQSFTWEDLLKSIVCEYKDEEYFLDLKDSNITDGKCNYAQVAQAIEDSFTEYCLSDRNGKFKEINDTFYDNLRKNVNVSRLKLYIANMLKPCELKPEKEGELELFKRSIRNIASIITTNYDCFVEKYLGFHSLIGNDILLSNEYGSVYKVHGCVTRPDKLILTEDDYRNFETKYELIRAQLLSLFIHHPIVFMGYSINDKNIKDILKTIFSYVESNSDLAKRIRDNFLLVEYEEGSDNEDVVEHDIDMENYGVIKINKIKTDNYTSIFAALEKLILPISVMDIRKVQTIVKEISAGGDIKVSIADDLDGLDNSDKILAIGGKDKVYIYKSINDMMAEYFSIIEQGDANILELIDKQKIANNQFFPIFGFAKVCRTIKSAPDLKLQQKKKLKELQKRYGKIRRGDFKSIAEMKAAKVSDSYFFDLLTLSVLNGTMDLEEVKEYLLAFPNKTITGYKKLLCAYDFKVYSGS